MKGYADQGDDVLALLEKERNKLTQQVEYHIEEAKKRQGERDAAENKLAAEKKRHEAIVLYLIQERKHMLLKIHELRCKTENAQPSASTVADRELIEELKKEVTFLRGERESLKNTQKMLKSENLNLKEVVKGQEADLLLLRKNLISTAKITMEKPVTLPQLADDRALVVANRGVTSGRLSSSTTSRLSTSSSFPMEKSRLPRAPITSVSTTNSSTIPRHSSIVSPRTIGSPTKKTPIMGVSSARRPQSAQQHLPAPTPPNEPEFDELEAAIQSMNVTATSSTSSSSTTSTTTTTVKRSSSLPRDRPTSSLTQLKRPDVPPPPYKLTSTKSLVTSSPTTSRAAETRKLSGTVKRNGILAKAFGK
ncbi:unnamed protein product [Caenorhabditis auriculariae]|uniref:Cortactin-binding protein-2 N-terminal domain-containing protein n=1 Tax=Caenorhabditis auriculariae TaxID=2777116 RepID=A0A8S1H601_9PELO|nr:unnamed protein product [Caenorhabditis auriculariae]